MAFTSKKNKGGVSHLNQIWKYKNQGKKSETAMPHGNKTWKYPVDTTCQKVSYLLLGFKCQLVKDAISGDPK